MMIRERMVRAHQSEIEPTWPLQLAVDERARNHTLHP